MKKTHSTTTHDSISTRQSRRGVLLERYIALGSGGCLTVLLLLYGYLIVTSTSHVVSRKHAEVAAHTLSADIAELEMAFLDAKAGVSDTTVDEYALVNLKGKHFVQVGAHLGTLR